MKNFIKPGHVMTFTAPTGGVKSGVPLVLAALFIIPATDAIAGDECEGATVGVFELPKATADVAEQFAAAYWDGSTVTTVETDNKKIGVFIESYANGTDLAGVRLDGVSV